MKMHKGNILVLAVAAVLALGGCKGGGEQTGKLDISSEPVMTENAMPITENPVTLSCWTMNLSQGYAKSYNDFEAFQILKEKTGVELKFIHPTGGAPDEQLGVMIASDDLPDLVFHTWHTKWKKEIENGTFLTLNDYIDKWAPNFRHALEQYPEYQKFYYNVYNGKAVAFPTLVGDNDRFLCWDGYFIRKDWLDKVGMQMPNTIEEWEAVLRAFCEKDPNGNGKKDEIGFSTFDFQALYVFMPAFDVARYDYFISPTTGKVTHAILEPRFKEYLQTMNRWYQDGLINSNYLSTTGKELDAMVLNNELGAFHSDNNNSMPKYMQANPEMELVAAPYVRSSDGKRYYSYPNIKKGVRDRGVLISSKCQHIKEAVRYLDYMYSDEASTLMNWGVKGDTFDTDAQGNKYFTDFIMKNPDGKTPYEAICKYMTNTGFAGYNSSLAAEALEANLPEKVKATKAQSVEYARETEKDWLIDLLPTTAEEDAEILSYSADLDTYLSEMYNRFIMGLEPLDAYDAFVEKAKSIGIEKVIAIKQAAYDRIK